MLKRVLDDLDKAKVETGENLRYCDVAEHGYK